ncbi:MAG: hypothetical protein IJW51_00210 [Clostridia bacterium]|nr:hypothetical protein [Clostridia bacterium]
MKSYTVQSIAHRKTPVKGCCSFFLTMSLSLVEVTPCEKARKMRMWEEKCPENRKNGFWWGKTALRFSKIPKTESARVFPMGVETACGKLCGNCVKLLCTHGFARFLKKFFPVQKRVMPSFEKEKNHAKKGKAFPKCEKRHRRKKAVTSRTSS